MSQGLHDPVHGCLHPPHYNLDIIKLINQSYTISVAIVPNTWEEYTVAQLTATTGP